VNGPVGGLGLKTGYFDDPKSFTALVDLLKDAFDIDIGLVDKFGGPDPTFVPFAYFDVDGRCVANFSAFSMPLVLDGRVARAVGYQSGAVRPEFRGQGLYRDLMRRAFAWADGQDFEFGILLTDKRRLYEPYGFRSVPQHAFRGRVPAPATSSGGARALSSANPDDARLVRHLLAGREPVSQIFAVGGHTTEFLLNACFDPDIRLSYLPGCDAVVAWRWIDGEFSLLDVVAARIPPLAEIVGALGMDPPEVTVCFPPDRLAWPDAEPHRHVGACDLMMKPMRPVRLPVTPFMLSPMAEF
jgi:GNAT superfamily N-acetyltransferase